MQKEITLVCAKGKEEILIVLKPKTQKQLFNILKKNLEVK